MIYLRKDFVTYLRKETADSYRPSSDKSHIDRQNYAYFTNLPNIKMEKFVFLTIIYPP